MKISIEKPEEKRGGGGGEERKKGEKEGTGRQGGGFMGRVQRLLNNLIQRYQVASGLSTATEGVGHYSNSRLEGFNSVPIDIKRLEIKLS